MNTSDFDISEYLDSPEIVAEYLNLILSEGDSKDLIVALGNVARAMGMTKIAKEAGMSRPSLYKALSEDSKPQFSTIFKVLKAIGGQIKVEPLSAK